MVVVWVVVWVVVTADDAAVVRVPGQWVDGRKRWGEGGGGVETETRRWRCRFENRRVGCTSMLPLRPVLQ